MKRTLDRLLADYNHLKPEELIGENGLLKQLTKGLLERALQFEMTAHLGHEKNGSLANKGRQRPQRQETYRNERRTM